MLTWRLFAETVTFYVVIESEGLMMCKNLIKWDNIKGIAIYEHNFSTIGRIL